MKQSDDLGRFGVLIASSASSSDIATVPATQTAAGDGTASIALGFPPETFIARAAGGVPPRGQDMNGLLNRISRAIQILQAGYLGPFDATFAAAIGGYPSGAIVSGSAVGTFWVSTADNNVTVPGADGATWKSLFDGYATQAWSNSWFIKNVGGTGGIVGATMDATTGQPTFQDGAGKWHVMQAAGDYATKNDLNSYATQDWTNSWFIKNVGGTGGIVGATMDATTGQPTFQDGSKNWHQMQVYGQCPKFSDFVSGWSSNGYIEIPTAGNWKLVIQWVQFQGVTGPGGNNGAGRYETEDIFIAWPLGMDNLLSIAGLAVEDVVGIGMQEQVWKMMNPTATVGSFRMACNASGVTMNGSAVILGSIKA